MSTFLEMGGYGQYVWPAYLVSAALLFALLLVSFRSLRAKERKLEALRRDREDKRR